MNFCKTKKLLLILLLNIFQKLEMFPLFLCLGTIRELPAVLLSVPLVWVLRGGVIRPLQPLYDGPYAILRRGPCSFTIRVGSQDKVIAVSCLKACMTADAQPGSPWQTARLVPRWSCRNQVGLVFRPAGFFSFSSGATPRRSRNHIPTWRGGFCMPWTDGAFTVSTDAVPVLSTGTTTKVRPLTSSPSS
jgi:hypothetical protein